jgi:hypothetical protein
LFDKVCQWLETGRRFSLGTPVSSTNKTDRRDITEILLKVALNTIKQTNIQTNFHADYKQFDKHHYISYKENGHLTYCGVLF